MRRIDFKLSLMAFAIHGHEALSVESRYHDHRQDATAIQATTPLDHSKAESSQLHRRWQVEARHSRSLTDFAMFLLAFNPGSGVPAAVAGAGHAKRHVATRQLPRRHGLDPCALQLPWKTAEADLTKLADVEAFQAKIEEAANKNKVIVIGVFASWCRACKALKPKYRTIAQKWQDVEFCEILYDENKCLAKSQGFKSLPFVEIYLGSKGKVEGFQCGPTKIGKLQEALESYATDEPAVLQNR